MADTNKGYNIVFAINSHICFMQPSQLLPLIELSGWNTQAGVGGLLAVHARHHRQNYRLRITSRKKPILTK